MLHVQRLPSSNNIRTIQSSPPNQQRSGQTGPLGKRKQRIIRPRFAYELVKLVQRRKTRSVDVGVVEVAEEFVIGVR
jgi:hypothetical protein